MLVALSRNRILPTARVAPLQIGNLEIDALDLRVRQGSREVRLSPSEHVLLYTLAARSGTVVSHAVLAQALGTGPEVRTNTIARHVATLRGKLRDDIGDPRYIETVAGAGYRFIGALKK